MISSQTKSRIHSLGFWNYLKYKSAKTLRRQVCNLNYQKTSFMIRPIKSDLEVLTTIDKGEFDATLEFHSTINTEDSLIIDAGGHIGLSAVWFAQYFPRATILSIEPACSNFTLLKQNTQPYENIIPLFAALSNDSTSGNILRLQDRNTGPWGYSVAAATGNPSKIVGLVPTVSIEKIKAHFSNTKQITLLKMDIEGGEKTIFVNDTKALSEIPLVLAELHNRICEGSTEAFRRCFQSRKTVTAGPEKLLAIDEQRLA